MHEEPDVRTSCLSMNKPRFCVIGGTRTIIDLYFEVNCSKIEPSLAFLVCVFAYVSCKRQKNFNERYGG